MKSVFIYALKDPNTGQIRYVGKSSNPSRRFRRHTSDARQNSKCHRANWIRSLLAKGARPVLEIVDEVLESEWQSWEAAYIQFYREQGCDLVNTTLGGDGVDAGKPSWNKGLSPSRETREKIRSSLTGVKLPPERRAKASTRWMGVLNPNFGKTPSPQTILKMQITTAFNRLFRICQPIE